MNNYAALRLWTRYRELPAHIRALADQNYAFLQGNPRHPLLRLKKIDELWAVRVGTHYRVLGLDVADGLYGIWIGTHAEYDTIIA